MELPKIFISYSWASKNLADKIYDDLNLIGFRIIKDDHTLKYKDRISEFMANITKADYAILLICDDYLKSINCMTEVLHLMDNPSLWDKSLPILKPKTKIYELEDRIGYIKYWEDKSKRLDSTIKQLNPANSELIQRELDNHVAISKSIQKILADLSDQLNISTDQLFDSFYKPLTDRMKIEPNFQHMSKLIPISFIPDPSKRLERLKKYMHENRLEHTWCSSIEASCYRDLGKTNKAITYYKKSVQQDPLNDVAWNNLGRVYEKATKNYSEAQKSYLKAIEAAPKFDVPRLNLGPLLSDQLNDIKGAIEQYEAILAFDENNPRAHNNLGNIYKGDRDYKSFKNLEKAEQHFQIAVSQNLLEAFVNYGGLMEHQKSDPSKAKELYSKAKELDTDNVFGELIDILIKQVSKKIGI